MNTLSGVKTTELAGLIRSPLWISARSKHRTPPRFFGRTKTQILDVFMKSSVVSCACITSLIFPVGGFIIYRYITVSSGNKKAEEVEKANLLSEGRYNKA